MQIVTKQRRLKTGSRWGRILSAFLVMGSLTVAKPQTVSAEDKILLMQSSSDGLIADMEYMVKQLAKQQKQWSTNIEPNIELFLDGVDRSLPIVVDLYFDEAEGEYYRPAFPVSNLKDFRNNLDALGITSKPVGRDLFLLENAFEGHMRILSKYSVFAPTDRMNLIPSGLGAPDASVKTLLDKKYDAAVLMDHEPSGVEARKNSLKKVRSNALAEIKKKSTESVAQFELRKLLAENQFDKLEQFYSEIDFLEAGWITDSKKNEGIGTLTLSAIEGTPLDKKLKQIPENKTPFVAVPETKDFVATGRLQYPIDLPGQERLKSTYQAYRPVIEKKIEDHKEMSSTQKQAAKQAVEKTLQLLETGVTLGLLDGFVEMRKSQKDGLHEAIAGVKVKQGRDVEEILKLLPEINSNFTVKMDVETLGDLHLHDVVLEDKTPPMLNSLFGTPCQITVATSDDLLLLGFGPEAKGWLKETIALLNNNPEAQPLPEFIRFKGHMGPFAKALNAREPNKERPKLRSMLVDAFSQGDDYIEIFDKYTNNRVEGTMKVEPGVLRFLGLAVAKFAEENL